MGLLRTTSRSESSNFYFGNYVQRDKLSEFYLCYQSAIEKQWNNSRKLTHYDDYTPKMIIDREIEKDALRLYTRALFYKAQEEIRAGSMDIVVLNMSYVDNTRTVRIQEPFNKTKIFEVCKNVYIDVICLMLFSKLKMMILWYILLTKYHMKGIC